MLQNLCLLFSLLGHTADMLLSKGNGRTNFVYLNFVLHYLIQNEYLAICMLYNHSRSMAWATYSFFYIPISFNYSEIECNSLSRGHSLPPSSQIMQP
jgi:hypothetical protein